MLLKDWPMRLWLAGLALLFLTYFVGVATFICSRFAVEAAARPLSGGSDLPW